LSIVDLPQPEGPTIGDDLAFANVDVDVLRGLNFGRAGLEGLADA
jgi:hypothetical protein